MKTFIDGRITMFVSDDIVADVEHQIKKYSIPAGSVEKFWPDQVEEYLPLLVQGQAKEYIDLFGGKRGRIAILHAHGGSDGRTWNYADGDQVHEVQQWLEEHDGKFACLVCFSCNPGHHTVTTKKSLLVIPDRSVGHMEDYVATLIHPKRGEIDDYTIDYELEKLKKQKG